MIVETEYPGHRRSLLGGGRRDRREPFVAVDYRVALPRGAGVTIESFAGDVTVRAVDGETRVETISGDVRLTALARLVAVESFSGDLELTDVRAGDALTARTVSGDIDIEKVRAPRLEVKSFSGAVALRGWSLGESKVETVSGSVTLDGVLSADGRYGIRSFSGSILLTVPDDSGFELEAESFSGSLRSDVPVLARPGTTVLGGGSRTIRGTAGEGGAGLELFTVSGDIAISTGGEGGTATLDVVPRSLLLPTPLPGAL